MRPLVQRILRRRAQMRQQRARGRVRREPSVLLAVPIEHAARERALHARGHRSVEPAPGIYRISVVVHLMSLPEQRFLEVY